jgi:bacterioferritin (cytochrome b1)
MDYTIAPYLGQSRTRRIGGILDVKTVARHVGHYAYAELRLVEAQAGWIAYVPLAELKIELGYQLYEDACHVDAMYHRLPELGAFDNPIQPPNEAFVRFCNELTNTEDLIERLVGLYWVLRPHLVTAYRKHIDGADSVTDYPTVRILERALADHERFAAWGNLAIRHFAHTAEAYQRAEEWRDHLLALLNAAGGVTGAMPRDPSLPTVMPRDDGPVKRLRKDPPLRDSRFRVEKYIRHEGRAATDVWDRESLVKYMFMMVEGELEATESCGRTLFDFPEAPWELRFRIAQQLWDEARHAELNLQRFFEMGGKLDMLPVRDTFPLFFGPVRNDDLGRRLAHLNQVIEGWVTDDFAMMVEVCRGMGDERTARLFEYLVADEWSHIKIGADWIPKVTANDPAYRAAVIEYRTETERELYASLAAAADETAQDRVSRTPRSPFSNVIA